jgi:hypothetical protein
MNIIQPARLTFWRFIFAVNAALPLFSIYQLLGRAMTLGVDFSASRSWTGLIAGLGLICLFFVLLLASTGSRFRERVLSFAESPECASSGLRWVGVLFFVLALIGFTVVFTLSFIQSFFGSIGWIRILVFWTFSLIGMWGIKLFHRETSFARPHSICCCCIGPE